MNKKQGLALLICAVCVASLFLNLFTFPEVYGATFTPNKYLMASLIVGVAFSLVFFIWAGEAVKPPENKEGK